MCVYFNNRYCRVLYLIYIWLADIEEHAERNWGNEHFAYAMKLAFDAVLEVF